jgi:hypothetical protein
MAPAGNKKWPTRNLTFGDAASSVFGSQACVTPVPGSRGGVLVAPERVIAVAKGDDQAPQ